MSYFGRGPAPWLGFFLSWLKHKSQSRCSSIVKPRYLTYVAHEIYWPLILKFRCFLMFLLDLGLNSKISVLLVFNDILFALSHAMRTFKLWSMCLFIFFKELSTSNRLVSSRKWCALPNFMARFRWTRTKLRGTPNSIKALSDVWPLTVTCCFLLVR